MTAARSCRDDMQRLRCGPNRLPKDGRSRGKQTCRYTPDDNRHYYPEQAIDLRCECMAAAISRVRQAKPGAVYE